MTHATAHDAPSCTSIAQHARALEPRGPCRCPYPMLSRRTTRHLRTPTETTGSPHHMGMRGCAASAPETQMSIHARQLPNNFNTAIDTIVDPNAWHERSFEPEAAPSPRESEAV